MENLKESLKEIIEAEGLIFYDTQIIKEGENRIFRVLIKNKSGSVSIDDCVKITNIISPLLDVEEPLNGNYTLEVSSPGIERKLDKLQHYQLSIGEEVEIKTFDKRKFIGKLLKVDNDVITIKDKTVDEVSIDFDEIKQGKTVFSFS